jgi:hypothetical protein
VNNRSHAPDMARTQELSNVLHGLLELPSVEMRTEIRYLISYRNENFAIY